MFYPPFSTAPPTATIHTAADPNAPKPVIAPGVTGAAAKANIVHHHPTPLGVPTAVTAAPNTVQGHPVTANNATAASLPYGQAFAFRAGGSDVPTEIALRSETDPECEAALQRARATVASAEAQARAQMRGARLTTSSSTSTSTSSASASSKTKTDGSSPRRMKSSTRSSSKANKANAKSASSESSSQAAAAKSKSPVTASEHHTSAMPDVSRRTRAVPAATIATPVIDETNASSVTMSTTTPMPGPGAGSPSAVSMRKELVPGNEVELPSSSTAPVATNYQSDMQQLKPTKHDTRQNRTAQPQGNRNTSGMITNSPPDDQGQLSPEQLFVNMKELIMAQRKNGQSNRNQAPTNSGNGTQTSFGHVAAQSDSRHYELPADSSTHAIPVSQIPLPVNNNQTGAPEHMTKGMDVTPAGAEPSYAQNGAAVVPSNTNDVDQTTYQLAETRIGPGDIRGASYGDELMRSASRDLMQQSSSREMFQASSSREMDVTGSLPLSISFKDGTELHLSSSDELGKTLRKQRADDIDKVLNGTTLSSTNPMLNNAQALEQFRLGNGRLPASISGSYSFVRGSGGPFASREGSMEFRTKSQFGSSGRDMSVELFKRDHSMELMHPKKVGSQEGIGESSELARDMSIDCFGSSFRNTTRDMSIEMQFGTNQLPRGASIQLGTFGDDGPLGIPQSHSNGTNGLLLSSSDGRIGRMKIPSSSDDLNVNINNVQVPSAQGYLSQYRRGINGSIEDFREVKHPF